MRRGAPKGRPRGGYKVGSTEKEEVWCSSSEFCIVGRRQPAVEVTSQMQVGFTGFWLKEGVKVFAATEH